MFMNISTFLIYLQNSSYFKLNMELHKSMVYIAVKRKTLLCKLSARKNIKSFVKILTSRVISLKLVVG